MTLQPKNKRVFVKRDEAPTHTQSGIALPVAEAQEQGTVVAVANGLDVTVGERVLFTKWSGATVTVNGEELLALEEDDILAVFVEG